jgi:hypothetical protein
MSTPSCSSIRYARADFGGVDVEVVASPIGGADVDVDAELDSGVVESVIGGGGWRAEGGTDFSASANTSTVSRRSDAKRVIAKSRVCSFSRAALRWRLRKSAWRYRRRLYLDHRTNLFSQ